MLERGGTPVLRWSLHEVSGQLQARGNSTHNGNTRGSSPAQLVLGLVLSHQWVPTSSSAAPETANPP